MRTAAWQGGGFQHSRHMFPPTHPVLGLAGLSLAAACVLSALLGCAAVRPEHPRVIIAAAAAQGLVGRAEQASACGFHFEGAALGDAYA